MKLNVARKVPNVYTYEGGRAARSTAEQDLLRSVMACMLWEDSFYEGGEDIALRIKRLVASVSPEFAAATAAHARGNMHLRHVPLLIVREMARLPKHKALVSRLLADVIMRPDEITEFLAIYWKDDPKQPISAQVKKGLAAAFNKFDEYALAKYNRDGAVKLRDALFLSHARPDDVPQGYKWTKEDRKHSPTFPLTPREALFKRLVDGELKTPDTWEVALSAIPKTDTRAVAQEWDRLLSEKKLGALAFLRNLRNMVQADIPLTKLRDYAADLKTDNVLPFRFIAAARVVPQMEPILEPLMLQNLEGKDMLPGRTVLMVDVSGSMNDRISAKSDLKRIDAACGLAILLRELCEDVVITTFSNKLVVVPPRRGFALRDAIDASQSRGGTYLARSMTELHADRNTAQYDRIVVITDEQTADGSIKPWCKQAYLINVAAYKNGVGYGGWTTISGWSEACIDFIKELERDNGYSGRQDSAQR